MIGTGSTITFGTSSWTGNILDIRRSGKTRGHVQTSHMGTTGYHTKEPLKLADPGRLEIDVLFTPGALATYPPLTSAAETVTVRKGSGTGPSESFTGFVVDETEEIPFEDQLMKTFIVEISGTPTYSAT